MLKGEKSPKMTSVYNLLRESCGLSQSEAAEFVHEVRLDTVKSWSSDRRPAPQFAVNQLQSLLRTIRDAGEQFAKDLRVRSPENVFIIGHAHDDDDARGCGFPSLNSHMHSIAIAISLLPDDADIRLAPRVRGSIPAPIMEKEKIVATETDRLVLQGMTFRNDRCLTQGNVNRRKFERLEQIGWIKGISVNISDVEYYLTPAGRKELASLPTAKMYSKHFTKFGIPDTECEIEVRPDNFKLPRLFFRSPGNPLCGLDLGGASQLKQLLDHDGDSAKAQLIGRLIEQARKLA
jgi:hypothetical protein